MYLWQVCVLYPRPWQQGGHHHWRRLDSYNSLSLQRGWLAERHGIIQSGETKSRLWQLRKRRKEGKPHCHCHWLAAVSYILIFKILTFICQLFMVTGGYTGSSSLDGTEIFNDNVWRTVEAAKLPAPIYGLRVATLNNRVLSFGNSFLFVID